MRRGLAALARPDVEVRRSQRAIVQTEDRRYERPGCDPQEIPRRGATRDRHALRHARRGRQRGVLQARVRRVRMPVDPAEAFAALDVRVGTIAEARPFEGARKPSYQLTIDFGPTIGRKQSSVQLTVHYKPEELIGKQIIAAVNRGPKKKPPSSTRGSFSACPISAATRGC